jgi:hypothetical protein
VTKWRGLVVTTYFVDTTTGSDTNDGLSEVDAWATLGKTQTAPIAAGDKVWVKGSADYTEALTLTVVGTATAPIVFEGYTTTTGDGGMATVNGSAARATGLLPAAGSNFNIFKNFRFTNHTSHGAGNLTSDHLTYKKCRFDANGGDGVRADQNCIFEGCYSHGNTSNGFNVGAPTAFICCISNSNGVDGFSSEGGTVYKCIAFSNAGNAFTATQATYHVFIDCVADGDGKDTNDGFDISDAFANSQVIVINCVAYDCTTGFRSASGLDTERSVSRNNLVNANTTAYTAFATHVGEVTSAPAFVAEASQDYTPDTGSPLIAAGFGPETNAWLTMTGDPSDIGALDEVASGSCDYPPTGDVRNGTIFNSGGSTGTLELPIEDDVEFGVGYGDGGTEFTGTVTLPAEADVADTVQYGADGIEFTGTLVVSSSIGGVVSMRSGGQL